MFCTPLRMMFCTPLALIRAHILRQVVICRAGFLLKGAKHVSEQLAGQLPQTAEELIKIPGIGPYTSAAIASIAFGKRAAAVDGNVMRVMSRLHTIPKSTKDKQFLADVAAAATDMLSLERPGDWNQAIMELGATMCKPSQPDCMSCPLSGVCAARKAEDAGGPTVTSYPAKAIAVKKRDAEQVACAVWFQVERSAVDAPIASISSRSKPVGDDGPIHMPPSEGKYVLLIQRPETGLLAGMWEVLTVPGSLAQSKAVVQEALVHRWAELSPGDQLCCPLVATVKSAHACGTVRHQFTHISLTTQVFSCTVHMNGEDFQQFCALCGSRGGMKVVPFSEINSAGASTLTRKILDASRQPVLANFQR
jgi:adenine-specific DNA glycosylase